LDIRNKNPGVLRVKSKKGLRILAVVISLFIFLVSAYSCYFSLVDTNLSSADSSYESPDQDGLSMDPQNEFKEFAPNILSVFFFPVNHLAKWLLDISCHTLSTVQRPVSLRC